MGECTGRFALPTALMGRCAERSGEGFNAIPRFLPGALTYTGGRGAFCR